MSLGWGCTMSASRGRPLPLEVPVQDRYSHCLGFADTSSWLLPQSGTGTYPSERYAAPSSPAAALRSHRTSPYPSLNHQSSPSHDHHSAAVHNAHSQHPESTPTGHQPHHALIKDSPIHSPTPSPALTGGFTSWRGQA